MINFGWRRAESVHILTRSRLYHCVVRYTAVPHTRTAALLLLVPKWRGMGQEEEVVQEEEWEWEWGIPVPVVLVGVQRHKTPAVIGRGRRGREKHREAQRRKPEKVSQVLILYHLQRSVTRETELAATSLVSDIHSIFC